MTEPSISNLHRKKSSDGGKGLKKEGREREMEGAEKKVKRVKTGGKCTGQPEFD